MKNGLRTKCSPWGICLRALAALAVVSLSACGGGGGGGGGFIPDDPNGDQISYTLELTMLDANGNPTNTVSGTFPGTLLVTVREDNGRAEVVSGVVVAASATFAVISPENGQALTDANGVAEFEISGGSTLGADTINVTVESPAGTVAASIGVDIANVGLALGHFDGRNFVLGRIGLSSDNLAFRGTAVVRLAVVDESGSTISVPEQIRLTSDCSLSGQARFRAIGDTGAGSSTLVITTEDGLAEAEYLAGSCEDGDNLTAELVGSEGTATASLTIAGRDANYVGYISSDPSEGEEGTDRTIIAIAGTSSPGRPEIARIVFEVLEESVVLQSGDAGPGDPAYFDNPDRKPLTGVTVSFSLTNDTGGITLLNDSAVSDSNGLVEVEVQSGTIATSTRVVATISEGTSGLSLSATSNEIVVGTGVPDQNSLSLTADRLLVPLARNQDGVQVILTVRAADKFNNPVADGTSAVFTTEYGAVDASCLTGEANGARYRALVGDAPPLRGTCSVLWISQAPREPVFRPDLLRRIDERVGYNCLTHSAAEGACPGDLGAIRGYRSTVVVMMKGDESFVDTDGNAIYGEDEPFENLPEPFVDNNEDGVFTPYAGPNCPEPSTDELCAEAGFEEVFFDEDENGEYSENVDPNTGEGIYNGSLCPNEIDGIFCSSELATTRSSLVLTLSSGVNQQTALMVRTDANPDRATPAARLDINHEIYIADAWNNPPGVGTSIRLEATGDCQFIGSDPTEITSVVTDNGNPPGAFTIRNVVVEDRVQSDDPDNPNPDDTGTGSIFVYGTDPGGSSEVLLEVFQCQTIACVPDGMGGFSPAGLCPSP